MKSKHYRQGDVLIRYVDSLPSKLKPVLRKGGRLVLARGNSGHDHYIADPGTELFTAEDGGQWLSVKGDVMMGTLKLIEKNSLHVLAQHPIFGPLAFSPADVKVKGKTVHVDGHFAILFHDAKPLEHAPQALPRGLAEQMDQSEYNREEVRRVTD